MEHGEEEVGLALGLSLGSGHNQQQPSPPCVVEPSLSLSLPAAVKRELRTMEVEDADEAATDGRALYSSSAVEEEGCSSSRKKLRLTKEQSALLEERFKEHCTLNPDVSWSELGEFEVGPYDDYQSKKGNNVPLSTS